MTAFLLFLFLFLATKLDFAVGVVLEALRQINILLLTPVAFEASGQSDFEKKKFSQSIGNANTSSCIHVFDSSAGHVTTVAPLARPRVDRHPILAESPRIAQLPNRLQGRPERLLIPQQVRLLLAGPAAGARQPLDVKVVQDLDQRQARLRKGKARMELSIILL